MDSVHGCDARLRCIVAVHGSDALVRFNWPWLGLASGCHMAFESCRARPGEKRFRPSVAGAQGDLQKNVYSIVFPKEFVYSNLSLKAKKLFTVILPRGGSTIWFIVIVPVSREQPPHRRERETAAVCITGIMVFLVDFLGTFVLSFCVGRGKAFTYSLDKIASGAALEADGRQTESIRMSFAKSLRNQRAVAKQSLDMHQKLI